MQSHPVVYPHRPSGLLLWKPRILTISSSAEVVSSILSKIMLFNLASVVQYFLP